MPMRPNLLFIFTDQQSALALGSTNPWLNTPAMDSLAARGVRFDRNYCAAPVCGPSRACLVSGRAAHQTGVRWNGQPLRQELTTFGQPFREAGYTTAWAGKWHLPKSFPTGPEEIAGFENLSLNPEHPFLKRDIGYGWPGYALGANTDGPFVDEAIRFLERPHHQPFLLSVSLHNPHDICWWVRKPRPLTGRPDLPPLPDNFDRDPHEPEFLTWCRKRDHYGEEINYTVGWSDTDWRSYLHAYYRMTEHVDAEIGRLLAALRRCGLEENTVVVFTSDHGEGMAAHQWVAKLSLYQEVVRVPLLVAGPGVAGNGRVDDQSLVNGLDIAPTLCDLAGIAGPESNGLSLRPLIQQPGVHWKRDHVVCELSPDDRRPELDGRLVVSHRYAYASYAVGHCPETLFDLQNDPGEKFNLASRPEAQIILNEHRIMLQKWIHETNDPFSPAPTP